MPWDWNLLGWGDPIGRPLQRVSSVRPAETVAALCDACGIPLDSTDCCPQCGVWHADPCVSCGRRGYHKDDCPEIEQP